MPKTKKTIIIKAGKEKKKSIQPEEKVFEHVFSIRNYFIFGLGMVLLILGYFFLAQPAKDPGLTAAEGYWSLNVAPIVLILAYLVVIPIAILMKKSRNNPQNED
jgi:Na+-transporting NADH:ubiquinone oxidoreductase subunit NqrB